MKNIVKEILKFNRNKFFIYLKSKIDLMGKVDHFLPSDNEHKSKSTNLFFGSNSKILSGYSPLVLDDIEAYFVLFETLKQNSSNFNLNNENEIDNFVCDSIQKAVFRYFGNGVPNDVVRTMLYKTAHEKDEDLPISKFKGTNMSMCTERSALAHNFFKILGYNSSYVSGMVFLNGQKDLHSYNAVQLSSGYKIFDLVCTPTKSIEHNLPNPIMCNLDVNMGKMMLNNGEIDNLDLPQTNFKSQSGKDYFISYGNIDKFEHFESA